MVRPRPGGIKRVPAQGERAAENAPFEDARALIVVLDHLFAALVFLAAWYLLQRFVLLRAGAGA